jgi:spore germination protein
MRKLRIVPLLICCLLMSGCWDKIEIDRRVFISTIGIDGGKDLKKEQEKREVKEGESFGEREIEKLKVTFAFPDISKYSAEKKQIPESKFIKVDSYSMEDALEKATGKSSRSIDIGHIRLLLLGSDVLNYPETVKELIDYLNRQPKINRTMYVIVAEGRVEDFLNADLLMENNFENYFTGLMLNSRNNASILPITLNEFLILLSQNGNAIVPSIKLDKEKRELRLSGVALIKDYSLKGFLSPSETANLEMLRGKLKSGKKVIYKDEHPIDFEIDGITRKVTFDDRNERLNFNININMEGKIKGYYIGKDLLAKNELSNIETMFSKATSEECEKVVRLLQREFGTDPIGLREYVEKFQPQVWKRIEKNWEEAFKSAEVRVNVDTEIRRIGVTK